MTAAPGVCEGGSHDAIVLSWLPSATLAVTGYEILRATTSAGPYSLVGTVAGRTVDTYVDSPLSFDTTYYYVLRSMKQRWRSVETDPVSSTTRSSLCV